MKHAYVSLVLPVTEPPPAETIAAVDALLSTAARLHEIVLAVPFGTGAGDYRSLELRGPVSQVSTYALASADAAASAALSRAMGDFVLEWRGDLAHLDQATVQEALELTDAGNELVEIMGRETSAISRFFYRFVNSLRPRSMPVRKTVGRLFSRNSLGQLLSATAVEPQLDVLVAELPVVRTTMTVDAANPHRDSMVERVAEGGALVSKGTRFGSAVPLGLALVSAVFGVGAALYALGFFILRGQTPEGWTTLMIVMGLGQAAVLVMLGLVWTRINAMARGLSQRRDVTANVIVTPPARRDDL